MKFNFKRTAKTIWFHTKILVNGFMRVLYGTAIGVTFALAGYGFASIPSEGGYTAVCDFIGAIGTTFLALCCMYALGGNKKKGARR